VDDMDFLDISKMFSYRTIGLGETIRNPIKTFRELSRYVDKMANRKASGDDDLFKKAPSFSKEGLDFDQYDPRRALCMQRRTA